MLYANSLNIVQSMIAQGKVDFWVGFLVPHAIAALGVFLLFRHRMKVTGAKRRPARPAVPSPAT
jgi:lipopolysaccharide export LptBFGC system permease protein LptF